MTVSEGGEFVFDMVCVLVVGMCGGGKVIEEFETADLLNVFD